MNRSEIRKTLHSYGISWPTGVLSYEGFNKTEENDTLDRYIEFVDSSDQCFERSHAPGHVTGSALITNPSFNSVLLMHHKKLNKWLQLGGHADGCTSPSEVAMKEAQEESGMSSLFFPNIRADIKVDHLESPELPFPFDLDIHEIPERKSEAAHLHYDIRYLIVADPKQSHSKNEEANDLRWFSLEEAYKITQERSMTRQFDKLRYLRDRLVESRK